MGWGAVNRCPNYSPRSSVSTWGASWHHQLDNPAHWVGPASDQPDRDALLLCYFERKSAREMAQVLGISDEAAQKRVSRAVEKLRAFISKRNVTIGASGLTVLISANAVQSAPAALLATISASVFAGTAVSSSTTIATTKVIVDDQY